jgi:hypothetical protein
MEEKNIDGLNDHKILSDIKKNIKNTKFVIKYSTEYRILIHILHSEHNLSYRKIIQFCKSKFGQSPSIGHIKELIQDGEKAIKGRAENHMENPQKNEEISKKKVNPAAIRKLKRLYKIASKKSNQK